MASPNQEVRRLRDAQRAKLRKPSSRGATATFAAFSLCLMIRLHRGSKLPKQPETFAFGFSISATLAASSWSILPADKFDHPSHRPCSPHLLFSRRSRRLVSPKLIPAFRQHPTLSNPFFFVGVLSRHNSCTSSAYRNFHQRRSAIRYQDNRIMFCCLMAMCG